MSLNLALLTGWLSGLVLSFFGSLPPGLISLTVTRENLESGRKTAMRIALGAALVEMVQAIVSVQFSQLISSQEKLMTYFRWAAIIVFLALGIYLIRLETKLQPSSKSYPYKDFLLGVVVSGLNFLAYPYWLFYGTYLQTKSWLGLGIVDSLFLGFGVGMGTFLAMLVYIWLSKAMISNLPQIIGRVNKAIGAIFILFGIWQLFQLLIH
ncbi:MAG: LysE family transporter [Bacteroidia bacterium]|nr:LysE family transporter [Bacteroidia bacterium]